MSGHFFSVVALRMYCLVAICRRLSDRTPQTTGKMTPDEEGKIITLMHAARAKSRGYAGFFGWATNRDVEE